MQLDREGSSLFTPENIKCVEVNNFPEAGNLSSSGHDSIFIGVKVNKPPEIIQRIGFPSVKNKFLSRSDRTTLLYIQSTPTQEKSFMNGLHNARQLLEGLERSLAKTSKYEDQLLRCKSTHAHSHVYWWDSDRSEKESKCSKSEIKPRSQVNLAESWSTMSIVCLQYQYEELSKRYESLLRAYHDRCADVRERESALGRLRARTRDAHSQLAHVHRTLIDVGDKYLELCRKKQTQKNKYEERIKHLKATVRGVMAMCEHARLQLDTTIARYLETEGEAPNAQLLGEIRKCNLLFLENLRLKAQIEKLTPGEAFSEKR